MEGEGDTQGHRQPNPVAHHPSTGALSSSETPKDIAPMKSFRDVLSQSHTSTLSRRSTSPGFRLLWRGWGESEGLKSWLPYFLTPVTGGFPAPDPQRASPTVGGWAVAAYRHGYHKLFPFLPQTLGPFPSVSRVLFSL